MRTTSASQALGTIVRTAADVLAVFALPVLIVLAGTVGVTTGELTFSRACSAAWCAQERSNEAAHADAKALLMDQVATAGCDTRKRLSPRVAVVNAAATDAEKARGEWIFDTGVVRVVTFDEAWAAAKAGDVYVLGWCG